MKKNLIALAAVSMIALASASVLAQHATIEGCGRVGRNRGPATLAFHIDCHPELEGDQTAITIALGDTTYGWAAVWTKALRNDMILIKAVPLEGHEGEGVQPGPGPLLMITWNHPDSVKVLAVGARTWFKGSA